MFVEYVKTGVKAEVADDYAVRLIEQGVVVTKKKPIAKPAAAPKPKKEKVEKTEKAEK